MVYYVQYFLLAVRLLNHSRQRGWRRTQTWTRLHLLRSRMVFSISLQGLLVAITSHSVVLALQCRCSWCGCDDLILLPRLVVGRSSEGGGVFVSGVDWWPPLTTAATTVGRHGSWGLEGNGRMKLCPLLMVGDIPYWPPHRRRVHTPWGLSD